MVDSTLVANRIALIRDAVARIRQVLPSDEVAFLADRTAREVVILNLFIGLQHAIDLAAHWLSDAGCPVPASYRDLFFRLAEEQVLDAALAARLAAATGFRNLVARHYGVIDARRVYQIATHDLGDLDAMCAAVAEQLVEG